VPARELAAQLIPRVPIPRHEADAPALAANRWCCRASLVPMRGVHVTTDTGPVLGIGEVAVGTLAHAAKLLGRAAGRQRPRGQATRAWRRWLSSSDEPLRVQTNYSRSRFLVNGQCWVAEESYATGQRGFGDEVAIPNAPPMNV